MSGNESRVRVTGVAPFGVSRLPGARQIGEVRLDQIAGAGLRVDEEGRLSLALEGALELTADGRVRLRLGDGLEQTAGSPVALKVKQSATVVSDSQGRLNARVGLAEVTGLPVEIARLQANKANQVDLDAAESDITSLDGRVSALEAAPSGSATATTIEVDLGAVAGWRGSFVVLDAAVSSSSKVLLWQAPGPYTGKGTLADEADMVKVAPTSVVPSAGQFVVKWETERYVRAFEYVASGGRDIASRVVRSDVSTLAPQRGNLVRGNVKFAYMVLG